MLTQTVQILLLYDDTENEIGGGRTLIGLYAGCLLPDLLPVRPPLARAHPTQARPGSALDGPFWSTSPSAPPPVPLLALWTFYGGLPQS